MTQSARRDPWWYRWGRGDDGTSAWVWSWGRPAARLWVHPHVVGLEHVPATGPVIVVANHRSHADIGAIVAAVPRRTVFAATEDLLRFPVTRFMLRSQACPIVHHNGFDRGALAQSLRLLDRGRVLVLFPEGGLAPYGAQPFEAGAAYLAARAGVAVVPLGIAGTRDAWRHRSLRPVRSRHVALVFGSARSASAELPRQAAARALNRDLEVDVAHLEAVATRIRARARGHT